MRRQQLLHQKNPRPETWARTCWYLGSLILTPTELDRFPLGSVKASKPHLIGITSSLASQIQAHHARICTTRSKASVASPKHLTTSERTSNRQHDAAVAAEPFRASGNTCSGALSAVTCRSLVFTTASESRCKKSCDRSDLWKERQETIMSVPVRICTQVDKTMPSIIYLCSSLALSVQLQMSFQNYQAWVHSTLIIRISIRIMFVHDCSRCS